MERFFRFFAERHTLAIVITLMLLLLGLRTLLLIQRDVFPHVEFGELFVTTSYPGASPEDVELNVTNKIEEEVAEVTGVELMASYSMENVSVIYIVVDPDASDQDDVIKNIREAVQRVSDLPAEVDELPSVMELDTGIFPVVEVGLYGDVDYRTLREYARTFEKKLERISGVSSVDKFGYLDREVRIEVDPAQMDAYDVPLRAIVAAIAARNVRSTGGSFESYTSEQNVVTLAQFDEPLEVGDVIVRSSFDGPSIRVRDLAVIKDDFEEPTVTSRANGRFAISYLVYKKENADAIRTIDDIRRLVESEEAYMPAGVEVSYSNDFSRYIRNRMRVVISNGLLGLLFVLVLLGSFLSARSAFWVALGVPVTLLGTVFLLPAFDQSLDVIGLAAMIMIIGIVVDDAIIVAENIHRKRELGLAPLDAASQGIAEVYRPVVTTILTTFAAFAPMFFMTGIMGKFIYVIPLVITLALFIALIETTIALPAHLISGLLKREARGESSAKVERGWFHRVRAFYRMTISYVLKARYAVVVVSIALLAAAGWYATTHMDFILFPTSVSEEVFIRLELPRGTSLEATADKVREIEAAIEELPDGEVDSYVTRVGNQGQFVMGENENWAIVSLFLTPFGTRDRIADEIVAELREKTDRLEGYERIIYYIDAGGPPLGSPVTLRVVGVDDAVRAELADSVCALLATMDGIKDIDRNDKLGKDQIEVDIDFAKLARLGLTAADVARTVRIAYDGEIVTSVRYGDEDVEFRVILAPDYRRDPEKLEKMLVPNERGRMIPLGAVASLRPGPGSSSFYHYDNERAVRITADITQGVITPLEATTSVEEHFDLANDWPGMRFVVGGESEETQKSMRSLASAFIMAVIGIYFLLVLLFNSGFQPLMVMSAIPLGFIGMVIAFAIHREPLGFMAMMGFIGLSGVVVNDSLVLVSHINTLRKRRPGDRVLDIVADGAADRLRAVVLTTLTTVAGLLPLAYGIGGNDPFIAPMALAMGFGLLFASPITLALVPSLYIIMNDIHRATRWIARLILRRPRGEKTLTPAAESVHSGVASQGGP